MALKIYDTLAPQGNYPAVNAADVEMPDGSRLSEFNPTYPVEAGVSGQTIEPERHYVFGSVAELDVTLAQKDDNKAHEYWFDFEPTEGFAGLTITPEPRWMVEPQYPAGKRCMVGIVMGMAVMGIG